MAEELIIHYRLCQDLGWEMGEFICRFGYQVQAHIAATGDVDAVRTNMIKL